MNIPIQKKACLDLKHLIIPIFLALLTVQSWAQQSKSKLKTKLNTQVFEAESDEQSFSGKVRIVRDSTSDTEVFFEEKKHNGPYILSENLPSYGLFKARLEKSKKTGGPMVKVQIDNDHIKSVEIEESKERPTPNEKDVINSLFKK